MAVVVAFCVWFACPQPAHIHDVAPRAIVSAPVAPDTHRGMGSDVEQWRGLVEVYFSDVETAMCVLANESGGNPNARNASSGAAGLWQFIPSTWDKMVYPHLGGLTYAQGGPYDPELATKYAVWLQQAEGWTQWSAYRHCH